MHLDHNLKKSKSILSSFCFFFLKLYLPNALDKTPFFQELFVKLCMLKMQRANNMPYSCWPDQTRPDSNMLELMVWIFKT